jgi:hypothetical protein
VVCGCDAELVLAFAVVSFAEVCEVGFAENDSGEFWCVCWNRGKW